MWWPIKKCKQLNWIYTLKNVKEKKENRHRYVNFFFFGCLIFHLILARLFFRYYFTRSKFNSWSMFFNVSNSWFAFSSSSSNQMVCLFRFVALCCFFSLSFPFYQFQLRNFVLLVRSFARPFVCTCFVRNTLFLPLIIELKEPSNRFVVYIFLSMYVYKSLEDKCVSQPFILSLKLLKILWPSQCSS